MEYNSTFILDWDDTLFPTSWFITKNKNIQKSLLYELDNKILTLINKMLLYGKVIIVTNASLSWVRMSSSLLPNIADLIQHRVKILSARDHNTTKKAIFSSELRKIFAEHDPTIKYVHNIISIGDATEEYFALVSLKSLIKSYDRLKAIRLLTDPNIETILDQINILIGSINEITKSNRHLDLQFSEVKI